MNTARLLSPLLLAVGIGVGSVIDRPAVNPPLMLGGYRVLSADFHTHSSTWSDGALTPWGLVLEAERQGLDAIAITGHNQVSDAKVGRSFAARVGGPTVIVGQEILAPGHHVIAVGIERVVDHRRSVADQIDDVHAQGGVAIAAHPLEDFWPAYGAREMARLDGAEICHPLVYGRDDLRRELEVFRARASLAAIGSSDFHGLGRMGMCRTYVFARDTSTAAIVEALRAHRTVVYGPAGMAYGDPALVALAANHPELRAVTTAAPAPAPAEWVSRLAGVAGLLALTLFQVRSETREVRSSAASRRIAGSSQS